ncbi:MAG: hypothetical protein HOP08_18695 [Cyclobacteriaceae bacterium]|nr:hypothetical protein [Cyclobacteriaceae bacterium]
MADIIDISKLEFLQDKMGEWYCTLDGTPFTGTATQYLPGGSMLAESNFLNGYPEGIQREWYPNGKLKTEYSFKDYLFHGPSHSWYENGELKYEGEHEKGKEVWGKRYGE